MVKMIEKKGELKFKYIPHSKCPYCGAEVERYIKYAWSKWKEDVRFTCGCAFESETPTHFKQTRMCKKTKEYKKLKEKRLEQFEKVNNFIIANVTDKHMLRVLESDMRSLKINIETWWTLYIE